jgi:DNA uptake protein ComE-like DNA-binding protein
MSTQQTEYQLQKQLIANLTAEVNILSKKISLCDEKLAQHELLFNQMSYGAHHANASNTQQFYPISVNDSNINTSVNNSVDNEKKPVHYQYKRLLTALNQARTSTEIAQLHIPNIGFSKAQYVIQLRNKLNDKFTNIEDLCKIIGLEQNSQSFAQIVEYAATY